MIPHHQQAIELARLVDGRTRRPELAKLASNIAAEQSAEIQTMRRWLTAWNQPVAGARDHAALEAPGMLGGGQLDWLKGLKGARFDVGFVTMMRTHHGGAVDLAEAELRTGASGEVKVLAAKIVTVQKGTLRELHAWKDAWSPD